MSKLQSLALQVEQAFAQCWPGNYTIGYDTEEERAEFEAVLRDVLHPNWMARVRWQRCGAPKDRPRRTVHADVGARTVAVDASQGRLFS